MKGRVFLLSLLTVSMSVALQANAFWKADLHENLTNVNKIAGKDGFTSNKLGQPWPGIGPNGEAGGTVNLSYSRIPAMTITDDNKMVVMFDLRWRTASDQNRIDPGVVISEDGGKTWEKRTAWSFNESKSSLRRAMDPTVLHNNIDGSLYVLHGTWSEGSQNWYRDREMYFNNNIWAATIYKSTDGGYTWQKNSEFSKTVNADIFSKVQKGTNNPTIGFLGGVGSGIVMRDGTLIFPIQTAHKNGIATTIMYSKDNGQTWDMPAIENALAPNQSSLENMVFEIDGKLVMTGREDNSKKTRWAYYTEDLGKTWHVYEPVNDFSKTTAAPSQGSSIYVTLPSGKRVLLVSKPNGNGSDGYARGNLALWMLDAKDPNHKHQVAIIRSGSGNRAGAGYSSLAYKEGNLFIAFEDDGDITVKNLTEHMQAIEDKAIEWGLTDEIVTEVAQIRALEHLNKGQKDTLSAKMQRANDNAISESVVLNREMKELKDETTELTQRSATMTKALPSKIKQFNQDVKEVKGLTNEANETYLNYLGVQDLMSMLRHSFLALNTQLDFSKYVKYVEKLNSYDTDIIYSSYNNVFVEYDSVSRNSKHSPSLAIGMNTRLGENIQAGVFFEHDKKVGKTHSVGIRAKYAKDDNVLSAFLRHRTVKHDDFIERNNNADFYVNYAKIFKIDDHLTLAPSIGTYASLSSKTLIDEDVALNKRLLLAGDVGLNIAYNLSDLTVTIRPNVAIVKDGATLSQANYKDNQHKIKSNSMVYGVSVGLEKQFANSISLGTKLKLQKYASQFSEVNLGVNLGYNW
ncbi:exo-alpha-sialidase [Pasteurella canis]|uniref:sialidase family protein n=1 Tax=Pasteurella canis TaxID=753 RepID=UPI001E591C7C|nr:exo-alpha-sialidase [Pasteurella canis]UEA17590.1 exo-alpha-sialidase [Pasteurella canis]